MAGRSEKNRLVQATSRHKPQSWAKRIAAGECGIVRAAVAPEARLAIKAPGLKTAERHPCVRVGQRSNRLFAKSNFDDKNSQITPRNLILPPNLHICSGENVLWGIRREFFHQ